MNFSWQVSSAIAESLCKIFKEKTAIEWEKYLSSRGVVGVRVQSFKEWMADEDAKRAKISAAVEGFGDKRQVSQGYFVVSIKHTVRLAAQGFHFQTKLYA